MAKYNCIMMDIDNTLLDFDAAERKALLETLQQFSLPCDEAAVSRYHEINSSLWGELNKGKIRRDKLVIERFDRFVKEIGAAAKATELNRAYTEHLATHADVIPGAEEALQELAEVATMIAVSNGTESVERGRLKLSGFEKYFDDIFISEAVGVSKPNPKIFQMAMRKLGIEHSDKVLVVGDSLSADIQGGVNAGLDTCWVNMNGLENESGLTPTYEVKALRELYPIVMEEDELQNVGLKNRKHQNDAI
mgnify:FL=1